MNGKNENILAQPIEQRQTNKSKHNGFELYLIKMRFSQSCSNDLLVYQSYHPTGFSHAGKLEAPLLDVSTRGSIRWDATNDTVTALDLLPDAADDTSITHRREASTSKNSIQ